MKRITDSIRKSVKSQDWYGALSTALTLPDVCGRLESPESVKSNSEVQARLSNLLTIHNSENGISL